MCSSAGFGRCPSQYCPEIMKEGMMVFLLAVRTKMGFGHVQFLVSSLRKPLAVRKISPVRLEIKIMKLSHQKSQKQRRALRGQVKLSPVIQ